MSKTRVYELAKEFGIENKEFIAKLKTLGIAVKSHSSTLEDSEVERVRREFASKGDKEVVESPRREGRKSRKGREGRKGREAGKGRASRETGEAARAEGGGTAGGCGASRRRRRSPIFPARPRSSAGPNPSRRKKDPGPLPPRFRRHRSANRPQDSPRSPVARRPRLPVPAPMRGEPHPRPTGKASAPSRWSWTGWPPRRGP